MKKLVNLRDLMLEQMSDLYHSEQLQLKELPIIQNKVKSPALKDAIEHHVSSTKVQLDRLNAMATKLNVDISKKKSTNMRCLLDQANEMLNCCADPEVMDAAIITAIQQINHYEIAGYGTTTEYAHTLGLVEIAYNLHEILEEERKMDQQLTKIAKEHVNVKAKAPLAKARLA